VHGLSNSTGILGSLPRYNHAFLKGDAVGRTTQRFIDPQTGQETLDDPRLGALAHPWERVTYQRQDDDPEVFERFRNMETGEEVNADPRLSPEALTARGVDVRLFRLV